MLDAAIDYVGVAHAFGEGGEAAFNLGNHSFANRAGLDHASRPRRIEGMQQVAVTLHTFHVREQYQLFSLEGTRECARGDVGVDIISESALTGADRRDDGNKARLLECGQHVSIDPLDLTDQAEVDEFAAAVVGDGHQQFVRDHQIAVFAGEADGAPADPPQHLHNLLVQLLQDHLGGVHGGGVGNAHAAHEVRLQAQAADQFGYLRAAAVYHDHPDTDRFEQHHIAGEALAQFRRQHRVAAVLDDEGGAAKALNVGQRLGQHPRPLDQIHGDWFAAPHTTKCSAT